MKNEMDLLGMDERQRLGWLLANRGTLLVVGVCWLAMIGWEFMRGNTPTFLIAMVPVFALVRLGFYSFYMRKTE